MYTKNAAEKQQWSPRRQYRDEVNAGIGASGVSILTGPQASRYDHLDRHVGEKASFKKLMDKAMLPDNQSRKRDVCSDIVTSNFHDLPPEIDPYKKPKKEKWSKHHSDLIPPSLPRLDLVYHSKRKPTDFEMDISREHEKLSPRRLYKDQPDGHKNMVSLRADNRSKWVGKEWNGRSTFGKRTIKYLSEDYKRATYRDQREDWVYQPKEKLGKPPPPRHSKLKPLESAAEATARKRREIFADYDRARLQLKAYNHRNFTMSMPALATLPKPSPIQSQQQVGAPLSPRTWEARGQMDRKRLQISTSDSVSKAVVISTPSMKPLSRGNVSVKSDGKAGTKFEFHESEWQTEGGGTDKAKTEEPSVAGGSEVLFINNS